MAVLHHGGSASWASILGGLSCASFVGDAHMAWSPRTSPILLPRVVVTLGLGVTLLTILRSCTGAHPRTVWPPRIKELWLLIPGSIPCCSCGRGFCASTAQLLLVGIATNRDPPPLLLAIIRSCTGRGAVPPRNAPHDLEIVYRSASTNGVAFKD